MAALVMPVQSGGWVARERERQPECRAVHAYACGVGAETPGALGSSSKFVSKTQRGAS